MLRRLLSSVSGLFGLVLIFAASYPPPISSASSIPLTPAPASGAHPAEAGRNASRNTTTDNSARTTTMTSLRTIHPALLAAEDPAASLAQWSVECLVVVDKAAYSQWLGYQSSNITGLNDGNSSNSRSKQEKERRAEVAIRNFVTSTFLAANLIWKGMEAHGVRLDLRIQELIIVKDEVVAPPNPGGRDVDSDTAFWAFLRWLIRKGKEFDHAVLLTGLNLVSGRPRPTDSSRPGRPKDSEGYAYMDTMCSSESASLVEAHVNGVPAVVMAHEVAHSLGACHDGDGNNCSRGSGHIMDDDNIGLSPHHWTFSDCSAAAIRRKLQVLDSTYDCLSAGSTRAPPFVYRGSAATGAAAGSSPTTAGRNAGGVSQSSLYLGQLFSADQMCQMREGTHSYLCRHLYGSLPGRRHDLCVSLYCLVNSTYCSGEASADGLPCGSGKRCLAGECVPFPDVPEDVSDVCYAGDMPHPAWRGQTCPQVVSTYTHICQDQWYQDFCCQSCRAVSTGDPRCPYGDAHGRCAQHYCGTAWEAECCQTCPQRP